VADLDVEIRQIEPGDRLIGLSLGDAQFTALKTFLQRYARIFHQQNLARTYAAFAVGERPKVVGYVTLDCGEIVSEDGRDLLDGLGIGYRYSQYPAIKIARLAVDERWRGRNLGSQLVQLALGTAKDVVCPAVGCRFVVVDAKRASIGFYEKCGFTSLDTPANLVRNEPVMFVDLYKIPAA
jgi:GNAT superfamily N-acetyltransferase